MKKLALIMLASLAATFALPAFASSEPQRYEVSIRLTEAGRVLAAPKLIITAGSVATFMSDDGMDGWTVKINPSPAVSPSGNAAVSLASDVEIRNGRETRRQITTMVVVDEGETASLNVRPHGTLPAVVVEIKATPAP